ncbi:MAG: hypothetical protein K1X72_21240 [Pyrinomonadaceae bacterium]|nr:hypothetical protein [Pyrinomonadaceae bacterium]
MKIRRKTEISIQQTKRRIVTLPETEEIIACPECEGDEVMIAAESAASVFGFSRREVYRMVESGRIHFLETEAGILFICQKSLENNSPENEPKKN